MTRTPTTSRARRTRERILDTALELFNEAGSGAVTTNHIAARAGISPGNLYYWFTDKDEIVREVYARFAADHEDVWTAMEDGPQDLEPETLLRRMSDGAALSRRYAFLARELLGLVHNDPLLAAEYAAIRTRRTAMFLNLARRWRAEGVIQPLDDADIADLVRALWVIAETWLALGELDGTYEQPADGARLLRVVLRPYLTRPSERLA